jgi:hypothetical protein
MMSTDVGFLRQRERRNRFSRVAVPLALLGWLCTWAWLYFQVPLLADPWTVVRRLQRNEIAPGTLVTMASLLPVVVTLLGFLLVAFLAALWLWTRTEHRLLRLARADEDEPDDEGTGWTL